MDDIKIYLVRDRILLMNKIKKINNKELYEDIFKIVKSSNIEYTKNSYGVIFDFYKLPNSNIHDIFKLVDGL